jgi:putative spermidine/putrescine transport system permease protein
MIRSSLSDTIIRWVIYAFVGLVVVFLMAPILIIIPISFSSARYLTFPPPGFSFQWYRELVERPEWLRAFWVSLKVAGLCVVLSLAFGLPASFALVRAKFRLTPLFYALILSPMLLPSVVVGLGLFFLFSKLGITGSVGGLALGQAVVIMPIVVVMITATLQGFDRRLEQAALIFGASPLTAFRLITLPIIAPAIISAALFVILLSFDDLLIALFLSDPSTSTLSIAIWNNTTMQISPVIAAVSVCLLGMSILILGLVAIARRRA